MLIIIINDNLIFAKAFPHFMFHWRQDLIRHFFVGFVQSFIINLIVRRASPSYFGSIMEFKIISFILSCLFINVVRLVNNLEFTITVTMSFIVFMVIMPFTITFDKLNSSNINYRLMGSYSYSDRLIITIVNLVIY